MPRTKSPKQCCRQADPCGELGNIRKTDMAQNGRENDEVWKVGRENGKVRATVPKFPPMSRF